MKNNHDNDKVQGWRLAEFYRAAFSQAEVRVATAIQPKTLNNHLARFEEKMCLSAPAPGKRRSRLWSAADAILVSAMKTLADFEIPPRAALAAAKKIQAWARQKAPMHYEAGFIGLPDQLFGFLPPLYGGKENLVIQAATVDELWSAAKKHGHRALLVIDGARLARETVEKLWARYRWVRIERPEDWEKARFVSAEEELRRRKN